MTIDMSQFYQVFFEETAEHLADMESLLLALDVASPDDEQLNAIFRAAHSIKGSAGTFGFTDLADVTHILENLLDRIRKHELALRNDMVDAFLAAGDTLKAMLAAHQGGAPVAADAVAGICATLHALTGSQSVGEAAPSAAASLPATVPVAETVAAQQAVDIEFVPTVEATADALALPNLLDELRALGTLEVVARPASGDPGLWRLRLATSADPADIAELIEFIAERDAWRVQPAGGDLVDADGAFGLFAGTDDTAPEAAYGFFEPPASPADVATDDEGFGFFEPLPAAAPENRCRQRRRNLMRGRRPMPLLRCWWPKRARASACSSPCPWRPRPKRRPPRPPRPLPPCRHQYRQR